MTETSEPGRRLIDEVQWKQLSPQLLELLERVAQLVSTSYGYSISYIATQFWATIDSLFDDQQRKNDLKLRSNAQFQQMGSLAKDYEDYIRDYRSLLDILSQVGVPDEGQARQIISHIRGFVKNVFSKMIAPFVEVARRVGVVPAPYFDTYGTFRNKWNSVLGELERNAKAFGGSEDLSAYYAPDLGVPAKL